MEKRNPYILVIMKRRGVETEELTLSSYPDNRMGLKKSSFRKENMTLIQR